MIFFSAIGWVLLAANGAAVAEAVTGVSSIFPGGWHFLWTLVPATLVLWLSRWQMYLSQVKEYKEVIAGLVKAMLLHPSGTDAAIGLDAPPLRWRAVLRMVLWRFKPTVYGVVAFYDAEREAYFVTFMWLRSESVMDGYRAILEAFDLDPAVIDDLTHVDDSLPELRWRYDNCIVQLGRLPRPRDLRPGMSSR